MLRALTDISEAEHGTMRLDSERWSSLNWLAAAAELYEYVGGGTRGTLCA